GLLQNGRAGRHSLSTLDLSIQRALQERLERARRTADGRLAGGLVMGTLKAARRRPWSICGRLRTPRLPGPHDSQQRVNQLVAPRLRLAVLEKLLPELATARPELARQLGLRQPPERAPAGGPAGHGPGSGGPHGGLK
ncbi:MAG: hypothetical protein U5J62_10380, partial [Desulfurivibrio sp.]|nr:hypothetical protein [Desulfurivibrio sp.]